MQSARQFCAIYRVSVQNDGIRFSFCKGVALNGAIVRLNQQRKFSSFGRSSVSQKHTSTCVSVHGGGPSCQGCHIRVGCQLFKTLVIEYEQFQGLYGILFLHESCLYLSDSAVVQCQVLV